MVFRCDLLRGFLTRQILCQFLSLQLHIFCSCVLLLLSFFSLDQKLISFVQASINHMSASVRQQMVERSRRLDQAREDTTKQLYRDRVIDASILADNRVEDKRLLRAMQQMAQEKEMEDSLLRVSTLMDNSRVSVFLWAPLLFPRVSLKTPPLLS